MKKFIILLSSIVLFIILSIGYLTIKVPSDKEILKTKELSIPLGETKKIETGIRAKMADGYVLMLFPRSGLGFKYRFMLDNTVGIIDSDYYYTDNEGHIIIALMNMGNKDLVIKAGERFAQGLFKQYFFAEEEDVVSKRTGGFGSTN